MRFIKECDTISDFDFWGGAVEVWNAVMDHPQFDEIVEMLNNKFDDELMDETEINDYIWFDLEEELRECCDIELYPEEESEEEE